jgi:hypothetical protein
MASDRMALYILTRVSDCKTLHWPESYEDNIDATEDQQGKSSERVSTVYIGVQYVCLLAFHRRSSGTDLLMQQISNAGLLCNVDLTDSHQQQQQ